MTRPVAALLLASTFVIIFVPRSEAMSGASWYESCRIFVRATEADLKTLPIGKRLQIRDCQIEALRVFCDQGWYGDETHVKEKLLAQGWTQEKWVTFFEKEYEPYCPHSSNMPIGGPAVIAVQELEKRGGPGFLESFSPALPMLVQAFKSRYPQCAAKRREYGLVSSNERCFDSSIRGIE